MLTAPHKEENEGHREDIDDNDVSDSLGLSADTVAERPGRSRSRRDGAVGRSRI